jgi:hypothetical protein
MMPKSDVTALLISLNGGESGLVVVNADELGSHCPLVDGWTHQVAGTTPCGKPVVLFSDEDALLKGSQLNTAATRLWHALSSKNEGRSLFGTVIVTGGARGLRAFSDVPVPVVDLYRERWAEL